MAMNMSVAWPSAVLYAYSTADVVAAVKCAAEAGVCVEVLFAAG